MKNKKYTDEQDLSLFDGHEDLIQEVAEPEEETATAEETAQTVSEVEEAPAPFTVDTVDEGEDPYYDENEVVVSEDIGEEELLTEAEGSDEPDGEADEDEASSEEESQPEAEPEEVSEKKEAVKESVEKPRRIDSIFDFIELFIFTLAAVFLFTTFFFKYSNVVGDSMQNTLQSGEKLILSSFLYNPKPGDVVVVDDRSLDDPIVKRVIAVGGQTVRITREAIYVDGERLVEDYVLIDSPSKYYYSVIPCEELLDDLVDYKEGEYYEILVPDNEIFVMGDHRNKSSDSRDIGTLHEDSVLGKVVLRFFPFDKFGKIE